MSRGARADYPTVYLSDDEILRHTGFVRAVLRGRRVPQEDLEDLVQETLLGAFRSMMEGRFRPDPSGNLKDAVRAWLRRIALNVADHELSRVYRRRERLRGFLFRLEADAWDLDARLDAARDASLLFRVRAKLRTPVLLRAMGFEFGEIGAQLGVPLTTVFTRIRRGRRRFRLLLRLLGRR